MLGVLVNTLTVVIGSIFGMLLKKGIPDRITNELIKGIGLCTMCIGWVGTLKGENTLIMILSMDYSSFYFAVLCIFKGL